MNRKFLLSVALVLGSFSMSVAQTEDSEKTDYAAIPHESDNENFGFGGNHSCVKADFNCGLFRGCGYDRGGFGLGYSLSYEYVFRSGVGVGLEYIREHGHKADFSTFFVGPSFVFAKSHNSWTFNLSSGLGASGIKYDSPSKKTVSVRELPAIFAQGEVQKRFSKHFGIAAGLRVMGIFHFEMNEWQEKDTEPVTDSAASLRFTIGPRFYF